MGRESIKNYFITWSAISYSTLAIQLLGIFRPSVHIASDTCTHILYVMRCYIIFTVQKAAREIARGLGERI